MPPGEHVHIISAGKVIHTAYPAIFRTLPTITRTYVLADSFVYEISSNPEVEKGRVAVRDAVAAVKEISGSLSRSPANWFSRPFTPLSAIRSRKSIASFPVPGTRSISLADQNSSATPFLPSHPGWTGRCILHLIRRPPGESRFRSVRCGPCSPIPITRQSSPSCSGRVRMMWGISHRNGYPGNIFSNNSGRFMSRPERKR
jgi:hypothetical protein